MSPLLLSFIALVLYMSTAFVVAILKKDNSIADIAYGDGFIVLVWFTYVFGHHRSVAGLLLGSLVTLWGLRLMLRILKRNWGKPEDFRYRKWREEWGRWFLLRSFFQIFMLQGVIIAVVCLPVLLVNTHDVVHLTWLTYIGMLVWVKGFFYEAVGDQQLDTFMANPENKGKILATGLWRYTRHPNYFGESLMWWGIAIASASVLSPVIGMPLALLSFAGPLLITVLLLYVSGVPLVEARFAGDPAWEAYKARTSVFVPWFPKK